MPLILLRHLEPPGAAGRCYGRTDLKPGPRVAAEAAGLAARLPAFARVVSSPARRCRALAGALAAARGLAVAVDARLAEMDFGAWEGRLWEAVPRAELDAWAADLMHARPHGGESVAMLRGRVAAALAEWERGEGAALLVTHGGVVRAARALAGEADGWTRAVGYGAWIELRGGRVQASSQTRSSWSS